MISSYKKFYWACWKYVAHLAGRSYIVGPELKDALRACGRLVATGMPTTLCYWNTEEESTQQVTTAYLQAIDAIKNRNLDSYLSIKAPALRFDGSAIRQVLERSRVNDIRLHFDSLSPEATDETFALIAEALPKYPNLGCTLPGRWRRSAGDADWAAERKLHVRVVKGQWADSMKPEVDLREGFLSVIDRLAGRARHVAVATHDAFLAEEALKRLVKAKTSCELELLYGLPLEPGRRVAKAVGVPVRLYLPYGHGWLPYSLSQVKENPRILGWVLRDLCRVRSRL